MRDLHRQALTEAESKKTELRLVLASRYRELVGSSDEVSTMSRDAGVLHDLVCSLPSLVDALIQCANHNNTGTFSSNATNIKEEKEDDEKAEAKKARNSVMEDRIQLSTSSRTIHSFLDDKNVHGATSAILDTFRIISKYTNQYPLVNKLVNASFGKDANVEQTSLSPEDSKLLFTQIKMIYFHLQTIPLRTIQLSKQILVQEETSVGSTNNAHNTARALSSLHRLNVSFFQYSDSTRSNKLLDLYFDSKAKLIHSLLDQLETDVAEQIISKIVWILQHDIILYPYQIFMLRRYRYTLLGGEEKIETETQSSPSDDVVVEDVMNTLPSFDQEQVKTKASNFLAAHLPLIRSKVKTVLVGIAGTTASRLGSIRQSLYDKTDGAACITSLSNDGICTWDEAVQNIVDLRIITRALDGLSSNTSSTSTSTPSSAMDNHSGTTGDSNAANFIKSSPQRKFSLWGTLFSNTFSSLVHSILSTSFHSVHRQVVATLRASLANAPSFTKILPHEAYRNTLRIASELDAALKKVSDDAHELLVHAEEREESERRLRQSLYVQTCEIMGRLLNELRRMLLPLNNNYSDRNGNESKDDEDATKQLIIGRLCYLLKFRLTSLPKLLDPNSSPAVLSSRSGGKSAMITVAELQSAFEIADVDDDGLIDFEEAMEAMDGAFSGTQFHGAEMVRETMLLTSGSDEKATSNVGGRATSRTLTLSELTLLSARGLRHDTSGPGSSLGTIQETLNSIVESCFCQWSAAALSSPTKSCMVSMAQFMAVSSSTSDDEWKRIHKYNASTEEDLLQDEISEALDEGMSKASVQVGSVSSFIVSYFISVATLLNKSICPSDSLPPFPNNEYAVAMGIDLKGKDVTMVDTLRSCLLKESLISISNNVNTHILEVYNCIHDDIKDKIILQQFGPSALTQLLLDIKFISNCFFKYNKYSIMNDTDDFAGFEEEETPNIVAKSKEILFKAEAIVTTLAAESSKSDEINDCTSLFDSRFAAVYSSCSMFLSSLLGEHMISSPSNEENVENDSPSLILNPLLSSRRFTLLPIQAEQSVKELQLIRNLEKERADKAEGEKMSGASAAANAVSSSIGYFSSLLKKK